MQSLLPEQLDFQQKAKAGLEIEGRWPIAELPALADLIQPNTGDLKAHLHFDREGKYLVINGQVEAEVEFICQRCMQPMVTLLKSDFKLAMIIKESQADDLPSCYEPLLVTGGKQSVAGLLEDELLLVMPLVPRHEQQCSEYMQQQAQQIAKDAELAEQEKANSNPFAALKDLL